MAIPHNSVSVTNLYNFLLHYKNVVNGEDHTLYNLFKKLSGFLDTKNVTVENLKSVMKNLDNDTYIRNIKDKDGNIIDDPNYYSDMRKLSDLLRFYPVTCNALVKDETTTYIYMNNKVYTIDSDNITIFKNDITTNMKPLDYRETNILYKQKFNIVTGKNAYKLNTNLLNLIKYGLPLKDILAADRHDDLIYFYFKIIGGYEDLLNKYIHNIRYVTGPYETGYQIVPRKIVEKIVELNVDDFLYASTRSFIKRIQYVANNYNIDDATRVASNIMTAIWTDMNKDKILEELRKHIGDFKLNNVPYYEFFAIGIKDKITIDKYNGDDEYIADFLTEVKNRINML